MKLIPNSVVVFASVSDYKNAIPVVVNREIERCSTIDVSKDANDWIAIGNVDQYITIRMYVLSD